MEKRLEVASTWVQVSVAAVVLRGMVLAAWASKTRLEDTDRIRAALAVDVQFTQVRKIEAATAKLKLARLKAEKAEIPRHKAALVDVAERELRVKQLEEEIVLLKEQDVQRKLRKARALELYVVPLGVVIIE